MVYHLLSLSVLRLLTLARMYPHAESLFQLMAGGGGPLPTPTPTTPTSNNNNNTPFYTQANANSGPSSTSPGPGAASSTSPGPGAASATSPSPGAASATSPSPWTWRPGIFTIAELIRASREAKRLIVSQSDMIPITNLTQPNAILTLTLAHSCFEGG